MDLTETPIFIVDTETISKETDVPPTSGVVEIAALELRYDAHVGLIRHPLYTTLTNPGRNIPPEASAIHHITDRDVEKAPPTWVAFDTLASVIPEDALVFAHNADYDRYYLPTIQNRKWVCTCRLAHHIYPDAPNFSNQTLRYFLDVAVDLGGMQAHRAGADVMVTAANLGEMLADYTVQFGTDVDALVAFAESPYIVKKITFGKHKGQNLTELPTSYIHWLLRDCDVIKEDADLRHSVELERRRREGEPAL